MGFEGSGLLQVFAFLAVGVFWGRAFPCYLPDGMEEHLDLWHQAVAFPKHVGLVGCLQDIQTALRNVCLRLHAQPAVQHVESKLFASTSSWRNAIVLWAGEQRGLLGSFSNHAVCAAWKHRILISPHFLEGLSGQFAALALDAMFLGSGHWRDGSRWLFRFKSLWTISTHYANYLQHLSLEGFDSLSDLSYRLHRGEWRRRDMIQERFPKNDLRAEGRLFDSIAKATPIFRLEGQGWRGLNSDDVALEFLKSDRTNSIPNRSISRRETDDLFGKESRRNREGAPLLKHDSTSGDAVHAAVRRLAVRGRRMRLVEVGVFRANLSGHVWDRMVHEPGSLEVHLVDHWGCSDQPMWRPPWLQKAGRPTSRSRVHVDSLGTGSNMGGQSNETTMLSVWQRFAHRGAHCIEVSHWLRGAPNGDQLPLKSRVQSRADIYFHRTTTVFAARAFDDNSLDFVYIDADHKWWSVLQDLAIWWPKVKPGGILMGHDFHGHPLMEREGDPRGDSNDVPVSIAAFFRAPIVITLHAGFTWSVTKPEDSNDPAATLGSATPHVAAEMCAFLRQRLAPQYDFEICSANGTAI